MAEVLIARQPILRADERLFAYELLFRGDFGRVDALGATAGVMQSALVEFGMDTLAGNRRVFVNVDEAVLESGFIDLFDPGRLVVEVLETVPPTRAVLDLCRRYKAAGYTIAIDDVLDEARVEAFSEVADIVKVDFIDASEEQRVRIAERAHDVGVTLLAEKVETRDEVTWAKGRGYELFQGFFFSKPQVLSRDRLPGSESRYMRLVNELMAPDLDVDRVSDLIQSDVTIAFRLLKYVNSAGVGLRNSVESVRDAIMMLGKDNLVRWAGLIAFGAVASSGASEQLIDLGYVRALFADGMAKASKRPELAGLAFMTGLFSVFEALTGRALSTLDELNLDPAILEALTRRRGRLWPFLALVFGYERGSWTQAERLGRVLGISREAMGQAYRHAVATASRLAGP